MRALVVSLVHPRVVETAEERTHPRLPPQGVPFCVPQHGREPGAAGPAGAKDPDDVLGVDTTIFRAGAADDRPRRQLSKEAPASDAPLQTKVRPYAPGYLNDYVLLECRH